MITMISVMIPWNTPSKCTVSPNAKVSASRMTNFEPNSTSQAPKNRRKVLKPPGLALKNTATLCSSAIVALRSSCNSTAASSEMLNGRDRHLVRKFVEQVKDDKVDQHTREIAQEQSLPVGGHSRPTPA